MKTLASLGAILLCLSAVACRTRPGPRPDDPVPVYNLKKDESVSNKPAAPTDSKARLVIRQGEAAGEATRNRYALTGQAATAEMSLRHDQIAGKTFRVVDNKAITEFEYRDGSGASIEAGAGGTVCKFYPSVQSK